MTEKNHDKEKAAPPTPAAKEPLAGGIKGASGPAVALPPEAYMTEQEKAAIAGQPAAKDDQAPSAKKETK